MTDGESTQANADSSESAGSIGPFRLLQKIGSGGMGEVWLAEQTQPVHRRVALKVIKAGMDTTQVVARFEAKGQALALKENLWETRRKRGIDASHARLGAYGTTSGRKAPIGSLTRPPQSRAF